MYCTHSIEYVASCVTIGWHVRQSATGPRPERILTEESLHLLLQNSCLVY